MKDIVLFFLFFHITVFGSSSNDIVYLLDRGNYEKAAKLIERDCNNGDMSACSFLGSMYSVGRGVEKNGYKAVELFKKSCKGKIATGCSALGSEYEFGFHIEQDYLKALKSYRKACYMGSKNGCIYYEKLSREKSKEIEDLRRLDEILNGKFL